MSSGRTRPKLRDFIPRWTRRKQTPAQQLDVLRAFAARQEHVEHNR